jgi:O-antigen/teichoic acid export membrane protein
MLLSSLRRGASAPDSLLSQALRHADALLFAGANITLQATTLVCQLAILHVIPPEQMGVWSFVVLVEGYLLCTQLGVLNAMNREFPFFMGLGEKDKALGVARTAQAYALCNGTLLMLIFLTLAFVYGQRSIDWRMALLAAALTAPLDQYTNYLEGTFRSGSEFRKLSVIRIFQSVFAAVTLVLPWKYGFAGYCLRSVLVVAFPALFAHVLRPVRVIPRFDRYNLRLLLSTGWRLFLWNYLYKTSQSFPRLIIGTAGGALLLGLFYPVSVVVTGTTAVAASFSSYFYPMLTRRFAQNRTGVGRVALKAAVASIAVLAGPIALGVAVVPWIIPLLVPQYSPAVRACQVALVAGLLECMMVATIAFAATKAWRLMFVYLVYALTVRAAGAFGGYLVGKYYLSGDRLLGVAWGMLAAAAVMAVVTWLTVRRAGAAQPVAEGFEVIPAGTKE